MVLVSVLANTLTAISNAEKRGKRQVIVRPSSKVVIKFLGLMQKNGYIEEFEVVDDRRSGKIVINLNGRINKAGVISPRFDISKDDIEQYMVNILPARQFGHLILTTSAGMMDHTEAKKRGLGGRVLGFYY